MGSLVLAWILNAIHPTRKRNTWSKLAIAVALVLWSLLMILLSFLLALCLRHRTLFHGQFVFGLGFVGVAYLLYFAIKRNDDNLSWLELVVLQLPFVALFWLLIVDFFCRLAIAMGDPTSIAFVFQLSALASVVLSAGWFCGFSWCIHRCWPSGNSHPSYISWFAAGGLAIPLALSSWLGFVYLTDNLSLLVPLLNGNPFESTDWAEFAAPANPANRVILVENGAFRHPGVLVVYVKNDGQAAYLTHTRTLDGDQYFIGAWSKDGMLFVCTNLRPTNKNLDPSFAWQASYDFSAGGRVLSAPFQASGHNVRSFASALTQLISAHGGIVQNHKYIIDLDAIRNNQRPLWFWQLPEFSLDSGMPQ
jgi:hypothetical protein